MDLYFYNQIGPESLDQVLTAAGTDEDLNVHINSPGGSVYDGLAIYNFLSSSKNKVNVSIDGLAGSVASVIAMAGDNIDIHDSGMLMIHNSGFMGFGGNKEDLEKQIEVLDKIDNAMLSIYQARTGQSKEVLQAFMNKETFFTSKEAKKLGFVNKIIKPKKVTAELLINNDKMENVLKDIQAKWAALTGAKVEGLSDEDIKKIEEAAKEVANAKLAKEKASIGNTAAEQITSDMVKNVDYLAHIEKLNGLLTPVLAHIEATQKVLDKLDADIDSRVATAMDDLLSKVTSKTQVPAGQEFIGGTEQIKGETKKEYEASRKKAAKERERNRELTPN